MASLRSLQRLVTGLHKQLAVANHSIVHKKGISMLGYVISMLNYIVAGLILPIASIAEFFGGRVLYGG